MAEPFLGEIKAFAFDFAPRGWGQCRGQFLPIAQNQALFALLGTTYGGNGTTTFALPNLQGRSAIGQGSGLGLSNISVGQAGGSATHTLTIGEIPAHRHEVLARTSLTADTTTARNNVFARPAVNTRLQPLYAREANAVASAQLISVAGNGVPHENRRPFLVSNYCIALTGIFPSRN